MQAKIPQNVQIADKIVGPLTLKHMIILGVGGGFAYIVYMALAKAYYWQIWFPPVFLIIAITLVIAFVRIYNVSFIKFIVLFAEFNLMPRQRKWIKSSAEVSMPVFIEKKPTEAIKKSKTKIERTEDTIKKLDDISKILDNYGNKIEKPIK